MSGNPEPRKYYFLRLLNDTATSNIKILPFKNDKVTIGRSDHCSHILHDHQNSISRLHCEFRRKENDVWIVSNRSVNFIYINEQQIGKDKEKEINPGDIIKIGPLDTFTYKFGCKQFGKKRTEIDNPNDVPSNNKRFCPDEITSPSTSIISASQVELESRLKSNEFKHLKLLEEKQQLQNNLDQQRTELEETYMNEKKELEIKFNEGALAQKTMLDEKENLAKILAGQVSSLQVRLDTEKLSLERKLKQEEEDRQKLLLDKEDLAEQLYQEQAAERLLAHKNEHLEKQLTSLMSEKDELQQIMETKEDLIKKKDEEQQEKTKELQKDREKLEERLNDVRSELFDRDMVNSTLEQELRSKLAEKDDLEKQLKNAKEQGMQAMSGLQERLDELNAVNQSHIEATTSNLLRDELVDSVTDVMEDELQCAVCNELFITAIVLNCGHTFCKYCIDMWKKNKNDCPTCRTYIRSETRSIMVDNFINQMVPKLSNDMREKRQEIVTERNVAQRKIDEVAANAAAVAATSNNRGRRGRGGRRNGRAAARQAAEEAAAGANARRAAEEAVRANAGRASAAEAARRVLSNNNQRRSRQTRNRNDVNSNVAINGVVIDLTVILPNIVNNVPPNNVEENSPILLSDDDDDDNISPSISDTDSSSSTLSSVEGHGHFGGYGRCFNCGRRGHWANGCPDGY